jgi:D-amino-acid dehydrogenase
MRSCTDHAHAEGLAATLRLSEITNTAYDRMEADGISFRRHETGLLFLAQTDKGLREHEGMVGGLRAAGYSGRLTDVSPAELRSVEPAARPEIAGALHAEDDWHVQPYELCQSIAQWLANSGADLRARSSVAALTRDGAGWRVRLGDGQSLTCDRVLISAGAWSAQVARLAGLRLLLEPAKGYSITGTASTPPRHAIYMTEGKLGCSAFGGEVRLAGTLELAGLDDRVDPRRAGTLDRTAKRYLRDWTMTDAHTWTGFRPATPDGLPYIGQTAEPGLFIATGHGTLGVTLAAGTGLTLAQLMMGEPVAELEPFRPDRSPS